jgi:hypothetical protein
MADIRKSFLILTVLILSFLRSLSSIEALSIDAVGTFFYPSILRRPSGRPVGEPSLSIGLIPAPETPSVASVYRRSYVFLRSLKFP